MKKLGLLFKEISGNRIKKKLEESDCVFIVKNTGLSSPDMSSLRQSLKGINSQLFVVRNNIARRMLKDSKWDTLKALIDGSCGLVFIKEDPVAVSKVLFSFAKAHDKLMLKGGLLKEKLLGEQEIEALAKLPGREVLLTQLVVGLKSPITGLVFVLKGNLRKLVYCLEQIKNKKPS